MQSRLSSELNCLHALTGDEQANPGPHVHNGDDHDQTAARTAGGEGVITNRGHFHRGLLCMPTWPLAVSLAAKREEGDQAANNYSRASGVDEVVRQPGPEQHNIHAGVEAGLVVHASGMDHDCMRDSQGRWPVAGGQRPSPKDMAK